MRRLLPSLTLVLLSTVIVLSEGAGQVQLSLKELTLTNGELCDHGKPCNLQLRFCVGAADVPCGFVNRTLQVDDVRTLLSGTAATELSTAFTHRWSEAVLVTLNVQNMLNGRTVLQSRTLVKLSPSDAAPKTISTRSSGCKLVFRVRVQCGTGFFGEDCGSFCPPPGPRDNFVCTSRGRQYLSGWRGADCKEPVCTKGCGNGKCVAPDACGCSPGWSGATCSDCVPYSGCKNGYCTKPGTCVCKENWTGRLCDRVVDMCALKPCKNGGICTSTRHNSFKCICPEGFGGKNCSEVLSPCSKHPCGSNGVCVNTGAAPPDYLCQCDAGYVGRHCDRKQTARSQRPSVKMNLTVNDIRITVNEIPTGSPIEAQLKAITGLVVACLVLVALLIVVFCVTGRYPQSLRWWLRRDSDDEATAAELEEGGVCSTFSKEKRRLSRSDGSVSDGNKAHTAAPDEVSVNFHRSLHLRSPPPPYETCMLQLEED